MNITAIEKKMDNVAIAINNIPWRDVYRDTHEYLELQEALDSAVASLNAAYKILEKLRDSKNERN